MSKSNFYTVGGPVDEGIYISRPADSELFKLCKDAETFPYVLTPRQTGKSSLMVRTKNKLEKEEGIQGVIIDLQNIGSNKTIEEDQWYRAILSTIAKDLKLSISVKEWWQENSHLPVVNRLTIFLKEIVLTEVQNPIVVFIDEIDATLNLKFTDDFFGAIRSFYSARSHQPEFKRLSFVLIGVAFPSELIKDKEKSPFNIGEKINLKGFNLNEAQPLAEGLVDLGKASILLKEILDWTEGQPFLTQKICNLARKTGDQVLPGEEKVWIENLINNQVIEDWSQKDLPDHLKTVEDGILKDRKLFDGEDRRLYYRLNLYKRILRDSGEEFYGNAEKIQLILSGLVVLGDKKLKISNRIYKSIFNQDWISKKISDICPYYESLKEWEVSDRDEKFLLRRKKLEEAKKWTQDKGSLSEEENTFLSKSTELENKVKDRHFKILSTLGILGAIIATGGLLFTLFYVIPKRNELEKLRGQACYYFNTNFAQNVTPISFIKDGRYLVAEDSSGSLKMINLEAECNSKPTLLRVHKQVISVKSNPKNDQIASASLDGIVILSNDNGAENDKSLLVNNRNLVTAIDFSPDGQYLAIITTIPPSRQTVSKSKETKVGEVSIWNTNTRKKVEDKSLYVIINSIAFSQDGQYLAANNFTNDAPKIWKWDKQHFKLKAIEDNNIQKKQLGRKDKAKVITFSPKDNHLAIGYESGLVRILSLDAQSEKASIKIDDEIYKIIFSSDGETLAIIGLKSTQGAQLWKWKNQTDIRKTNEFGSDSSLVKNLAFSPNNDIALVLEREVQLWSNNNNYEFIARRNILKELMVIEFYPKQEGNIKTPIIVGADLLGQVFKIDLSQ